MRYADDLNSSSVLSGSCSEKVIRRVYCLTHHIPTKAAIPFVPSNLLAGLGHSMSRNPPTTSVTHFALITLKSFPESINDESLLFAKTFGETSFPMWWVASNRRTWPWFWPHQMRIAKWNEPKTNQVCWGCSQPEQQGPGRAVPQGPLRA